MNIKIIVALIGLGSIAVGALAQYYISIKSEQNKIALNARIESYTEFIVSVEVITTEAKHGGEISRERFQKLIKAKARIVLIGSDGVADSLHMFFKYHKRLQSPEDYKAFIKIVKAMQMDLTGDDWEEDKALLQVLFGR